MKRFNRYLIKGALALVAWVLSMPKEEAQAEFAITWAELKSEGWDLEHTGVISLTAEVLNRNANETQRLNVAPEAYKKALDENPIEALAEYATAFQPINDLAVAFTSAEEATRRLTRALKDVGTSLSDNPEDYI